MLSTTHAPVAHVKAPQTDFPVKPDNSSGPTHDSPSERPLRTKATFQHEKAPKKASRKATEGPRGERTTQAGKGPTTLNAPSGPGTGTKARRAASKPRRHPPPCSEPWKKLRSIRSDTMAPCHAPRSLQGLASRSVFGFLSLWKERFYLSFSLLSISI